MEYVGGPPKELGREAWNGRLLRSVGNLGCPFGRKGVSFRKKWSVVYLLNCPLYPPNKGVSSQTDTRTWMLHHSASQSFPLWEWIRLICSSSLLRYFARGRQRHQAGVEGRSRGTHLCTLTLTTPMPALTTIIHPPKQETFQDTSWGPKLKLQAQMSSP